MELQQNLHQNLEEYLECLEYLKALKNDPTIFNHYLVPSVMYDYLTLSLDKSYDVESTTKTVNSFVQEMLRIKPTLSYCVFEEKKRITPSTNSEETLDSKTQAKLNKAVDDPEDPAHSESLKFTLLNSNSYSDFIIFHAHRLENNKRCWVNTPEFLPVVVAIPGKFAHVVLESHFYGKIDLNRFVWNYSRLDLKPQIPDYPFRGWEIELEALHDFVAKQNLFFSSQKSPLRVDLRSDKNLFSLACIGKRTSNRVSRFYISGFTGAKTFEKELKHQPVKDIQTAIKTRNFFEFNKFCVQELLEIIECFVACDLTNPVITWKNSFLIPIKGMLFPSHPKHMKFNVPNANQNPNDFHLTFSKINTNTQSYLCSHLCYGILKEFKKSTSFKVFKFLMYCSTQILKNWNSTYNTQQFRDRINKFTFTQQNLEAELC